MISKKRKILLGIGIPIVVLVLGAWLFFRLHLSWFSLEDNLPSYMVTSWQEGDETVRVDYAGMFDMTFHLNEPLLYVGTERIVMKDGVRIRNGRPYLNLRDAWVFDKGLPDAFNAMSKADTSDPVAVIVNGLYGQGTEEQNAMIHSLLGGEQARARFELYFQWYNSIHELGHLITEHHGTYEPDNPNLRHMVDEEILVNSFAIAFWTLHGEEEKLNELEAVVEYILGNITPPVDDMCHLDFMRQAIDEGKFYEIFNFNNYGWFQFNIVRNILRERESLDLSLILAEMMGVDYVQSQPVSQTLVYPTLGTDMVPVIVGDVASVLNDWGIELPDIYISFSTDPNYNALRYPFIRVALEQNIEAGRVIPVGR